MKAKVVYPLVLLFLTVGSVMALQNVNVLQIEYPNRPVEFIVPWSPGGGSDTLMRISADHVQEYLGQAVPIINLPGVSGTIGLAQFSSKRPNGYTIALVHEGLIVSHYTGVTPLNWNSFEPIAGLTASPQLLAVNADSPWQTLDEFLAYAKEHPGEISFGVTLMGSAHIMGAQLEEAGGTKFRYVGYEGTGERVQALMGGHIDASVVDIGIGVQYAKSGHFRLLALGHNERLPELPDVPTFAELGYPEIEWSVYRGVVAPKNTPEPVLEKLNSAFGQLAKDQDYAADIRQAGSLLVYRDREEFAKYLQKLDDMISRLAKNIEG